MHYRITETGDRRITETGDYRIIEFYVILEEKNRYSIELRNRYFDLVKILTNRKKSCSWEYNRIGGCGRGSISLSMTKDEIETYIGPDYDVRIYKGLGTEKELLYRGYVETYKPTETDTESIGITTNGYLGQLQRINIDQTYTSKYVDVIVKDILDDYVLPNTSITYNSADIESTDFVVDSIDFNTTAIDVIKTLGELAGNYEWGVSRNLKFFFKKPASTTKNYLRFKKDITKFDSTNDYSQIINRLIIKGAGDPPTEYTSNNTESQAQYGIRTKIISNSAIMSTEVAQQYGTMILAEKARIQVRGTVTAINVSTFFENEIPIGKLGILKQSIPLTNKYGTFKYGKTKKYGGGIMSYDINDIQYILRDEDLGVTIGVGRPRPDIADQIKQLEFELSQKT